LNARRVLFTDAGVLRAPWRIFLFLLITLVATQVCAVLVGPLLEWVFAATGGLRGVNTAPWIECGALLIATAISLRWIDKRPWSYVWLGREAANPRPIAFGFAIGAAAIGLPIALLLSAHWLRDVGGTGGSLWSAAVRITMLLLPAALLEELLSRGYLLAVLREVWGWPWAIGATSAGFGALHLANAGANVESTVLVTLAGVFLAAVLFATRSLYAAWAAHFAWNWTMAVVFHTAVSGLPLESPRYRYVDAGPDWATGGDWGPEGGVPAGIGMISGIAYLIARRRTSSVPRREET
jgi:membrane protease YdiL (CAAX protease family)